MAWLLLTMIYLLSAPPNVEYFVDDVEADWTFVRPFDFVYMRLLGGSIRDWPRLMAQTFQ